LLRVAILKSMLVALLSNTKHGSLFDKIVNRDKKVLDDCFQSFSLFTSLQKKFSKMDFFGNLNFK
jgi:hypothetical protein